MELTFELTWQGEQKVGGHARQKKQHKQECQDLWREEAGVGGDAGGRDLCDWMLKGLE